MKDHLKIVLFILICTMFTGIGFSQTASSNSVNDISKVLTPEEQASLNLKLTQQKKDKETFTKISDEIVQEYHLLRKQGVTIPNYPKAVSIESMTIYLSQLKELRKNSSKNSSVK